MGNKVKIAELHVEILNTNGVEIRCELALRKLKMSKDKRFNVSVACHEFDTVTATDIPAELLREAFEYLIKRCKEREQEYVRELNELLEQEIKTKRGKENVE